MKRLILEDLINTCKCNPLSASEERNFALGQDNSGRVSFIVVSFKNKCEEFNTVEIRRRIKAQKGRKSFGITLNDGSDTIYSPNGVRPQTGVAIVIEYFKFEHFCPRPAKVPYF